MNRSEIEALVSDSQSRFRSYVSDHPERAFFWGVVAGVALTIAKSVILPIGLVCVGLLIVFWFLDDSETRPEGVVGQDLEQSSESNNKPTNLRTVNFSESENLKESREQIQTSAGNESDESAEDSQLTSSYVPLKPQKSTKTKVNSGTKGKKRAAKKGGASKPVKTSAKKKASAKAKPKAKSKASARKSKAAAKSKVKKSGSKKKTAAKKKPGTKRKTAR